METTKVEVLAKKARLLQLAIAGAGALAAGGSIVEPSRFFGPIDELASEISAALEAEYR
jgi:hypothetical protein